MPRCSGGRERRRATRFTEGVFTPVPVPPAPSTAVPFRPAADLPEERLVVPPGPAPARRTAVPWIAALAPVAAALGMWAVTGAPMALWFAALGPLIVAGTLIDGRRATRRERRTVTAERERARVRIEAEIARRHERERVVLCSRNPMLLGYLARPQEIWRPVPGREGTLVVGHGVVPSSTRVDADDDDLGRALQALAGQLTDAPVVVPMAAGVAVVGPVVPATAVVRALVLQLCASLPPGRLQVRGASDGEEWPGRVPHHAAAPVICHLDPRAATGRAPGDAAVLAIPPDAVPPPHCAAVLTLTGVDSARLEYAGAGADVRVEALGHAQAERIADALAARAAAVRAPETLPAEVELGALGEDHGTGGLRVRIGHDGAAAVGIDLVEDGPHAVVTGMTGAGKSELLITWITRLCAARSTRDVVFLLADFKGGTAFDALAGLPHVTGVLTDLDGAGAERALRSLRAEIRHRESVISAAGARDIDDPRVDLPRLVIVVDELAALLEGHRDLAAVFGDVAARGRALGMHLILGTQRATGVIREALMANCPLRIGLRVTDPADSRYALGTDAAAALPGDAAGRGLALIRRAADDAPALARIARTRVADIDRIRTARAGEPVPRAPWQPALPAHIPLRDLTEGARTTEPLIGIADEPEQQRRVAVRLRDRDPGLLVVGGPGAGKSTLLATIAAQLDPASVHLLPSDPEVLWDRLCELTAGSAPEGTVVVLDDLDVALAGFPPDYAAAAAAMLEHLCRTGRGRGLRVVVSTGRVGGPSARIAELLPRRAVLRTSSRLDHVAAGADPARFDAEAPAGRAQLDGRTVQIAHTAVPALIPSPGAPTWRAASDVVGLIVRAGSGTRRLRGALEGAGVIVCDIADDPDALLRRSETPDGPFAVVGEPEQWQRSWRLLQAVRARGELLLDASCLLEYRVLTGDRTPPPYCAPGLGRAWLLRDGDPPLRVVLPGQEPRLRARAA